MEQAEALGYATFAARGSRGPVDVLCFEDENPLTRAIAGGEAIYWPSPPPLVVQVGTVNKSIAATLRELHDAPRPIGSLCVVARRIRMKNKRIKWKFSTMSGSFDSLQAAIERGVE